MWRANAHAAQHVPAGRPTWEIVCLSGAALLWRSFLPVALRGVLLNLLGTVFNHSIQVLNPNEKSTIRRDRIIAVLALQKSQFFWKTKRRHFVYQQILPNGINRKKKPWLVLPLPHALNTFNGIKTQLLILSILCHIKGDYWITSLWGKKESSNNSSNKICTPRRRTERNIA